MAGPIILPSGAPKWPVAWGNAGDTGCCCDFWIASCCDGNEVPITRVLAVSGFTDSACRLASLWNGSWVLTNTGTEMSPACTWEYNTTLDGIATTFFISETQGAIDRDRTVAIFSAPGGPNLIFSDSIAKSASPCNTSLSHTFSYTHPFPCGATVDSVTLTS